MDCSLIIIPVLPDLNSQNPTKTISPSKPVVGLTNILILLSEFFDTLNKTNGLNYKKDIKCMQESDVNNYLCKEFVFINQ